MVKRIAYIGLSYPVMFDISKKIKSWLSPGTPVETFPIIDSPWGLMLLYDELWFLCRDVCPVNMRDCQFVKFVTDLYPNIDYKALLNSALAATEKPQCSLLTKEEFYKYYVSKTNYNSYISTSSTEGCWVKNVYVRAGTLPENYLFDIFVKETIQRMSRNKIEVIANGNISFEEYIAHSKELELTNTLILNGIPNYMTRYGPYHPIIEELRENKFLKDYRKWIITSHNHLQDKEIKEVKESVENELRQIQENATLKYFNDHSKKFFINSLFTTTAKTVVCTVLGEIPLVGGFIGGSVDLTSNIVDLTSDWKQKKAVDNDRWAGFVIEARKNIRNTML